MKFRFQFRLGTLFVVVTLIAAQCGAAMWVIRDRQRIIRERDELQAEVNRLWDFERQILAWKNLENFAKSLASDPAPTTTTPAPHTRQPRGPDFDPFADPQP